MRPDALAPGDIVDPAGDVLGRHAGIGRFTVGQAKRPRALPGQVVVALDAATRRIVVGPRSTGTAGGRLREVNWLVDPPARASLRREAARARRAAPGGGDGRTGTVLLDEPALAAPGQACVFYQGERVLGGGFIVG